MITPEVMAAVARLWGEEYDQAHPKPEGYEDFYQMLESAKQYVAEHVGERPNHELIQYFYLEVSPTAKWNQAKNAAWLLYKKELELCEARRIVDAAGLTT